MCTTDVLHCLPFVLPNPAAGMKAGETAAAQANCRALATLFVPWIFSRLYSTWRIEGPYLLVIGLLITSQLVGMCAGSVSMSDMPQEVDVIKPAAEVQARPELEPALVSEAVQ